MKSYKLKKKRIIQMMIILLALGLVFFIAGHKKCSRIKYYYRENNSVDYRVYLKENGYFDTQYLEKNKTYITSLIDYIDATFKYKINFDKEVSGNLDYKIVATIEANKTNSETGNYWTKEYNITEVKTDKLDKVKSHDINIEQKIDYNQYNDLLNRFIYEFGIQADSQLKVSLVVNGKLSVSNSKETIDVNSEVKLIVPLSKLAIEGKIETSNNNIEKEIMQENEEKNTRKSFMNVLLIIDLIMFAYYLFQFIKMEKNKDKYLNYFSKIRKINNEYDDIITRVKKASIGNFVVIDVESFDDLLNVYENVREPINFQYGHDVSRYFIINNKSCYVYTINKEDFENYE